MLDDREEDEEGDKEKLPPVVAGVAEGWNLEEDDYEFEEDSCSDGHLGKISSGEVPNLDSRGFAAGSVRRGALLQ